LAVTTLDFAQFKDFFRYAFPEPWYGHVLLEIADYEYKDERRIYKVKKRLSFSSLREIENTDYTSLGFLQGAGYHFYFCVAFLDNLEGLRKKDNVAANGFIWVDVDNVSEADLRTLVDSCPLYPTGVVRSGNGYHLYWKLNQICENPTLTEEAAKKAHGWVKLDAKSKVDGTWNCQRLLRVPGTWNIQRKYPNPLPCTLEHWNASRTYDIQDFLQQGITIGEIRLDPEFKEKYILKGEIPAGKAFDEGGRSVRDFVVIKELFLAGHTPDEIKSIFNNPKFGVSEKTQENGDAYLELTMAKVLAEIGDVSASVVDNGKVCIKKSVAKNGMVTETEISNFCVEPIRYIEQVERAVTMVELEVKCGKMKKRVTVEEPNFSNGVCPDGGLARFILDRNPRRFPSIYSIPVCSDLTTGPSYGSYRVARN